MKYNKTYIITLMIAFLVATVPFAAADEVPHPDSYTPSSWTQIEKYRGAYDDPRSFSGTPVGLKNCVPAEILEKLTFDVEKMKSLWSEVVGFKSPDVVGKVAPDIKPGKYTYQDLEKFPGFKELIIPERLDRMKPFEGEGHIANLPEFEIIPTRQRYLPLPVAEKTKENKGKTKLDEQGYLDYGSLTPGIPFPRPSGKFKANQVLYNYVFRYNQWGMNAKMLTDSDGFTSKLIRDYDGNYAEMKGRLDNRILMSPYGWYDKRAEKRREHVAMSINFPTPRDVAGTARTTMNFLDPNTVDQNFLYLPALRRVRKMSATDTQDPVMGQDIVYDDFAHYWQKISPTKYPYKLEVEEVECLVLVTTDGTAYLDTKNSYALKNAKMERRPMYRLVMTQLDSNYVYGKRILYIDREEFIVYFSANYDQKGRLYRTMESAWNFFPDMGTSSWHNGWVIMLDHVDTHSTFSLCWQVPAFYNIRRDLGMAAVIQKAK